MKFRRTLSSVFISVFLILAILVVVVQFRLSTYGMEKVRSVVQALMPKGELGLDVTIEGMKGTLMRSIRIDGLQISSEGETLLQVDEVEISMTIWDLVRLALGRSEQDFRVTASGTRISANERNIDLLLGIMQGTGPTDRQPTSETQSGSQPLSDIGFHVTFRNISLDLDYKGLKANSTGMNATLNIGHGLAFDGADINIPHSSASAVFFGDRPATLDDLRISVDPDLVISLSVSRIGYGENISIANASALAQFSDDVLSAGLFLETVLSSLDLEGNKLDIKLVSTTANAQYSFIDGILSYVVDFQDIVADSRISDRGLSVNLGPSEVSGSYQGGSDLSVSASISAMAARLDDYSAKASNLALDLALKLASDPEAEQSGGSGLGASGKLTLSHASFLGLEELLVDSLNANNLGLEFSFSSAGLSAKLSSSVNGHVDNDYIGSFSGALDLEAATSDFRSLDSAKVNLGELSMASLNGKGSLSLEIGENGISAGLVNGDNLVLSLSYNEGRMDLRGTLSDFSPSAYGRLYHDFMEPLDVVSDATSLDGNLYVSLSATEELDVYVSALLDGDYTQSLKAEGLFDLVESGRVILNTAANKVKLGSSDINAAITLEADFDSRLAEIRSLAVTTGGVRISYAGSLDFSKKIPNGRLSLQRASDGGELASIDLSDTDGIRRYDFLLLTPLVEDLALKGTIDWKDIENIEVHGLLEYPLLGDGFVDFSGVLKTSPLSFSLNSDDLSLLASLEDGVLYVKGDLEKLRINASQDMVITVDSDIVGAYDLGGSSFALALESFYMEFSDYLSMGFDMELDSNSLHVSNVKLGTSGEMTMFDGEVDLRFDSIEDILRLETSSLYGTVELVAQNGVAALRSSAIDDQFLLEANYNPAGGNLPDVSVHVAGQRQGSLYGLIDVLWGSGNEFRINAVYNDSVLSFYESSGNLGTLQINDIHLVADFRKMLLESRLSIRNERTLRTGALVSQSCDIELGAKVEGLATGLFQLLAGLDYEIDFTLGFSDILLADGFEIPDISVDMKLRSDVLTLGGEFVTGSVDFQKGQVDISLSKDLPISMKAKGRVGQDLDLLLTDISFPLPILNQFIDMPSFSFVQGIITGDVLVKGPIGNPSFYGMAFCQSYEMTLFYIPDQTISIKNVSMSIVDHTMTVSKTPLSGYGEKDGRYFYGDVSMEIVMQGLAFELFDIYLDIDKGTPVDFWYPSTGDFDMEIRTDLTGKVNFGFSGGKAHLNTDIDVSSTLIDFRIEQELPAWYLEEGAPMDMDLRLTMGSDVEFYYPEKDNSFINFTLDENKTVELIVKDGKVSTGGSFSIKSGQVYYFHNDFIIKKGNVDLTERKYATNAYPLLLNLTAEIIDYDNDGNKVVITMILQDSTLDNISPRFTSTPARDQNEILAMLGQSVLASGGLDQTVSLSSLATFAATATEALQKVGVLESNKSYSIGSTIRNALGLDIFSARSNILSNIIIDALPGELTGRGDVSILARYLDNTSIFAGKYLRDNWFIRLRLMLKADSSVKLSDNVGHFLAKDLILDTEISLDWDTPMGTLSVFAYPQELSVFDILDTIGFSVTKQFQF